MAPSTTRLPGSEDITTSNKAQTMLDKTKKPDASDSLDEVMPVSLLAWLPLLKSVDNHLGLPRHTRLYGNVVLLVVPITR